MKIEENSTLNKLEQRIADECGFKRIAGLDYTNSNLNTIRIAAKICLEVAEKAYRKGTDDEWHCTGTFEDFKKEEIL